MQPQTYLFYSSMPQASHAKGASKETNLMRILKALFQLIRRNEEKPKRVPVGDKPIRSLGDMIEEMRQKERRP